MKRMVNLRKNDVVYDSGGTEYVVVNVDDDCGRYTVAWVNSGALYGLPISSSTFKGTNWIVTAKRKGEVYYTRRVFKFGDRVTLPEGSRGVFLEYSNDNVSAKVAWNDSLGVAIETATLTALRLDTSV